MKREDYKEQYELSRTNVDPLIDKIYDDVESRTCESCKYFIKDKFNNDENTCIKGCGNIAIGCDVVYCSSDFGCNNWESVE